MWIVAPLLPMTAAHLDAMKLFEARASRDGNVEWEIAQRKLITPHYQHVDGTSFAAPLTASVIGCMLEANPDLTPLLVRDILLKTAHPIANVSRERQGTGAVEAGAALAAALQEEHAGRYRSSPVITADTVTFFIHADDARQVEVFGSWDSWAGLEAQRDSSGLWRAEMRHVSPGHYQYKFRIDGTDWREDPANNHKAPDNYGSFNSVFTLPDSG